MYLYRLINWNYVVLDEGHIIKSSKSKVSFELIYSIFVIYFFSVQTFVITLEIHCPNGFLKSLLDRPPIDLSFLMSHAKFTYVLNLLISDYGFLYGICNYVSVCARMSHFWICLFALIIIFSFVVTCMCIFFNDK